MCVDIIRLADIKTSSLIVIAALLELCGVSACFFVYVCVFAYVCQLFGRFGYKLETGQLTGS